MKKVLFTLAAILGLSLALAATSCGGGGGGSDDDNETPVAGIGNTGTGSGSSESGSGSSSGGSGSGSGSTGGSGSGSGGTGGGSGSMSTSVPEGLVSVSGATFDGTTTAAIIGSSVFISGRTITIPNLLVCDHEVTQGEYEQYCNYGGDNSPSDRYGKGNNYPAYYVGWYDALVYCNKRSLAEQLTPCYTIAEKTNPDEWGSVPTTSDPTWNAATCDFNANGYRLPTEAEWEYLARGGNLTNNGQTTYSGSDDDIDSVAWYKVNAYDVGSSSPDYGTHQVKTKDPNGKTLYDMSGNVWEWCWDRYGSISASTPSIGAAWGSFRVVRGGGWNSSSASSCAVSVRGGSSPDNRDSNCGFRVVCSRSE